MKHTVIAFLVGALLSGGAAGGYGLVKVYELSQENSRLGGKVKQQREELKTLKKEQDNLNTEYAQLQKQKSGRYDGAFAELIQAKEDSPLEALYNLGLKALEEKDYVQAYYALAEVKQKNPGFKEIEKHFTQAQGTFKQYQQQSSAERLENTYLKAFDHQAKGELAQAQKFYQAVLGMQANYKDTQKRLALVTHQLNVRNKSQQWEQVKQLAAQSYQLGRNFEAHGKYAQAYEAYGLVAKYMPQYKDVQRRLKVLKAKLPRVPAQPPPQTQTAARPVETLNCYQKGVRYGKCAALALEGKPCPEFNSMGGPPPECKSDPEFAKGMKSVVSANSKSMLKGFEF